jgi:hypothetical protein
MNKYLILKKRTMYIAKPDEVRKLTLEIVNIFRKSSNIDVVEDFN